MKTIKLAIQNEIAIEERQRVFSSCYRFCYCRLKDGLGQKEIRHLIKEKNLFPQLDSWFIQSAIFDANAQFEAQKKLGIKKCIFGGKKNWFDYYEGRIDKEEFKKNRLVPISSVGEACKSGNRKFEFDIIQNNQIIFKPECGIKIPIQLPKLRNNIKKELYKIEELINSNTIPVQAKLTPDYIFLSFDETLIEEIPKLDLKSNRILGLDLNPNYIGISILEFSKDETFKILHKKVLDFSILTRKSHEKSSSPLSKYLENKHEHELIEAVKYIVNLTKSFHCAKLVIEDLNMEQKDKKQGKNFNRLCNNKWNRNLIVNNIKKRCKLNGIKLIEINPAYTSVIGNTIYKDDPDMVASSIEVARRGYFKYQKGKFYPAMISVDFLPDRWKGTREWSYSSWSELSELLKKSKLKYRFFQQF